MKLKFFSISLFSIALLLLFAAIDTVNAQEPERYRISIGSREFTPIENPSPGLDRPERHYIVQFAHLPDAPDRELLRQNGIELYRYVGGNAYVVSAERPVSESIAKALPLRSVLPIDPEMKLSPVFERHNLRTRMSESGESLPVMISFFPGSSAEAAIGILRKHGLTVERNYLAGMNALQVSGTWGDISNLLDEADVELVEPGLPEPVPYNLDAADRVAVDEIRDNRKFRKVDGTGAKVGIWDGGEVDVHGDFTGRRIVVERSGDQSSHATSVAGIIAGSGKGNEKALGMAPNSRFYSYDFYGDSFSELISAVKNYGITISNNSWGYSAGWYTDSDDNNIWNFAWLFQNYDTSARSIDRILIENDVLYVKAAGNNRNEYYLGPYKESSDSDSTKEDIHPADPDYGSIASFGNAKNILAVGASMKDDDMTGFSSWGPTGDGRIKPDVSAPGYRLITTDLNEEYSSGFSGTSAATPVVSGVAALLTDYFSRRHKDDISALALKNLIIHSVRDAGPQGPDYQFGFGIVDAELAARVIRQAAFDHKELPLEKVKKRDRDENMTSLMIEDTVSNGKRNRIKFEVPEGVKELRISLVWHDQPGDALVNDLDVFAKTRGVATARPFLLNPNKPSALATTGVNKRDNVEFILVKNPKAGKWRILVKGSRVTTSTQKYSLIVSASDGNNAPVSRSEGKVSIVDVFSSGESENLRDATEKTSFTDGDSLNFYLHLALEENADYGSFYGTVAVLWTIFNPQGAVIGEVSAAYGVLEGLGPGRYWILPITDFEIPSGLDTGSYRLEAEVTLKNGKSVKQSGNFQVQ